MLTAQQVAQQLRGLNKKEVAHIPKEVYASIPKVNIFNVGPKSWLVPLGGWGMFTIHACEEGQPYSKPLVLDGVLHEGVATDMRKIEMRPESGKVVALDIIGQGGFKHASQDLTQYGVFIAAGDVPTEAELAAARAALVKHYLALVQEGDNLFAQGPAQIQNISADMRQACIATNQDREWAKLPRAMVTCPGCGDPVQPGVAIHGGKFGCGAILDQEKALSLGLIQAEPKQEKQKRA